MHDWNFEEFTKTFPLSTTLATLKVLSIFSYFKAKAIIEERHGLIDNLTFYRGIKHPSTQIPSKIENDEQTLEEIGFKGKKQGNIVYDYDSPSHQRTPILMIPPREVA